MKLNVDFTSLWDCAERMIPPHDTSARIRLIVSRLGGSFYECAGTIHVFAEDTDQARELADTIRGSGKATHVAVFGTQITVQPRRVRL
ncbi:MAG: hypothetical protein JXR29_05795 [Methylothermaceae bacterium]|nr:hypothetical protein [Methylothermaceae bacterium]